MEKIEKLSEAVNNVVMIANEIGNEVFGEIMNKAPLIIHQRFCHELVEVVRKEENAGKPTSEVPRAMEILNAIDVLIDFYPELKPK